jgi:adenosine deaminase
LLVDAFSMRGFVPTAGVSGHDQFFATFDRFSGIDKSHTGEWLDEVATRAAAQNEQYLEVMQTPSFFELAPLWNKLGWPLRGVLDASRENNLAQEFAGDATGTTRAELDALRTKLLAGGLRNEVARDVKEFDEALAARNRIEHCGEAVAAAGCAVKIRFLYQVLRAFPPQQVFAQTLLAFEVASADANVVGLNFVQPEDATLSMSEYNRQMRMLDYLHSVYPKVHIALHAGELAPGLVPPEGLRFHIREAVELGHAERIGHGVDVMVESDPYGLLREMASQHVMVEINLTSNDGILGITPPHHPLPIYRATRVPVALSTDDEGVSRIDLTHEFVRAAMEYGLSYLDLKTMVRASLEHSFLPGESLWAKPDEFTRVNSACAGQPLGAASLTKNCAALLRSSERASEQWELEKRFAMFESDPK